MNRPGPKLGVWTRLGPEAVLSKCQYVRTEMQKVNTFTRAAFLGSKNLPQNCVIHDKFSAIKSAWFTTFQCETPGNSEKYQETVWNRVKQSQTETLLVSSCCHKHLTFIYTTLHNILHQDFYPSWEIFTWASLATYFLGLVCVWGGDSLVPPSLDTDIAIHTDLQPTYRFISSVQKWNLDH